jgi:hypothetical protein
MTFADLYGTDMDTELGTGDRTQRFTSVLRKRYVNEAQRWFNEQTSCFVKRAEIALSDGTAEYDLEASGVIAAQDYLWPSKTTASLKRVDANSNVVYDEGADLPYVSEASMRPSLFGDGDRDRSKYSSATSLPPAARAARPVAGYSLAQTRSPTR